MACLPTVHPDQFHISIPGSDSFPYFSNWMVSISFLCSLQICNKLSTSSTTMSLSAKFAQVPMSFLWLVSIRYLAHRQIMIVIKEPIWRQGFSDLFCQPNCILACLGLPVYSQGVVIPSGGWSWYLVVNHSSCNMMGIDCIAQTCVLVRDFYTP